MNKALRRNRFLVSRTYDVVTPESASIGDFAESGFVHEARETDLEDILSTLRSDFGCFEFNCYPVTSIRGNTVSLYETDGTENYRTGENTREALHIEASPRVIQRLIRLLSRGEK